MQSRSHMNHNFSQIPAPQTERSVFQRDHSVKTTFDAAYLVPFYVDEILPADTVNLSATLLARLSTPLFPTMDNIFLDTFYFFVPNRLLWKNWERFNGAQDKPDDSIDFTIPVLLRDEAHDFQELSIFDYMGLPTERDVVTDINALPLRAYNLIWNQWFRDQNLQDSITFGATEDADDGPDNEAQYELKKRGKRHDYFTSCLPWPQKGEAVVMPIGSTAPVIGNGKTLGFQDSSNEYGAYSVDIADTGSYGVKLAANYLGQNVGFSATASGFPANAHLGLGVSPDAATSGLIADLSEAVAATINDMRQAFAYQKILERDARGGTRYTEQLKAHWGVSVPDYRLQRPEYLGGGSHRINITAVPQTSPPVTADIATGSTRKGSMAAYGQVVSKTGFNKSFVEHGYVIGIANVRSDITYQNQLHKMWTRSTRFDFYLPSLAHLGEQAVLNQELFYDIENKIAGQMPDDVFGYQERWAEMRYKNSNVTGKFRSNATGTLDSWHLATAFQGGGTNAIPLNDQFIQDDPPIDRIIAVNTEPHIIMDGFVELKHARAIPAYSIPGMMDRF
ncbi:MAG: major capsid protein [Microviridae sp.]|nr:MAG: major capsid protein [Microviridae sp.]